MAPVESVDALRRLIQDRFPPGYRRKMLHTLPDWPVVKERAEFLLEAVKGQHILDIGCTGALSPRLKAVAASYHGLDKQEGPWTVTDLDQYPPQLPALANITAVVMSEVLEHLANPGHLLAALAHTYPTVDLLITVPNAAAYTIVEGCEMVNLDHVAWYSATTLATLLGRYGWEVVEGRWYNGRPMRSEGLIVRARRAEGAGWLNDSSKASLTTT